MHRDVGEVIILVHLLGGGLPHCGFSSDPPGKWPQGHQWIDARDWIPSADKLRIEGAVMCAACIEKEETSQ